jgi:hypothetical protein
VARIDPAETDPRAALKGKKTAVFECDIYHAIEPGERMAIFLAL